MVCRCLFSNISFLCVSLFVFCFGISGRVAKGTTSQVELALDVDIDASGQGGPLPTLVMTSELVADEVLPDGSAQVRTTITEVTARDRPNSPVTADQMAEQTTLMRGLVLRGTLTPEGTLRDLKVDTSGKVLPPGLTAQLDTLSKSYEQVAMPLPTTPVGAGASWILSKTFDQSGKAGMIFGYERLS